MAKKRDDRGKEKKLRQDQVLNLDGDFISPVRSFRDLTPGNIKAVLFHSRYAQILLFLTILAFILQILQSGF